MSICICCEEEIPQGEDMVTNDGKPICEKCYDEDEEIARIITNNKDVLEEWWDETDEGYFKGFIYGYHSDIYAICLKWHSMDGWRGYYEPESEEWEVIHDDCNLAYSEDSKQLQKFDADLKELLTKMKVSWVAIYSRTSNLFSTGYDFMVKKEDVEKTKEITEKLTEVYRDPARFSTTAMTGKTDPEDFDPIDIVFTALAQTVLEKVS